MMSKKSTTRAQQAAQTRKRIISVAVGVFSEKSYDEAAVADICQAAGVAHGLLFHYFGSKRGLYLEAMRGAAEQLDRAFRFEPHLPPAEQLRQALASHLDYVATHRGLVQRLVLGGRGADPEAWEVFEAARWRSVDAIAQLFGVDSSRPAVRMVGRAAVSAWDEASVFWLQNDQPFAVDDMVDWIIGVTASAIREAVRLDPDLLVDDALDRIDPRTP